MNEELVTIDKLSKDIKTAAITLGRDEARFLVDTYYQIQEDRKRSANRIRALSENGEPNEVIQWFFNQSQLLEAQIKAALDCYSYNDTVGSWTRSIVGIGPVISAGLIAHIDIEKAPTAGAIWRYAGLDPSIKWEKGQKRPWNASLKTLCWKIGESFVKVSNNENSYYGKLYKERKEYEAKLNEEGVYTEQAAAGAKRVGKTTESYKSYVQGKLPKGHLNERAKRYAVKMFLSHLFEKMYWDRYDKEPPKPYIIEHGGHVHYVDYKNAA